MDNETRSFAKLEVRDTDDGKVIDLIPIVFDVLSEDLGGFRERIKPGAFTESLASGEEVIANLEHERGMSILGNSLSGTLSLSETEREVRALIHPPDTQVGRDTVTLIKRGDLRGGSFEFRVPDGGDSVTVDDDGQAIRTVTRAILKGVTVTSNPAYLATAVSARSMPASVKSACEKATIEHEARKRKLRLMEAE